MCPGVVRPMTECAWWTRAQSTKGMQRERKPSDTAGMKGRSRDGQHNMNNLHGGDECSVPQNDRSELFENMRGDSEARLGHGQLIPCRAVNGNGNGGKTHSCTSVLDGQGDGEGQVECL
jgi:hypothetical protein